MKRYNFFMPEQVISRLASLATKTGLTVSELIRRAVDDYLRRNK